MEYSVKLSQFEGPLDLLLHLINSSKINIEDIFVSEVTEQYLTYMKQLDEIDMDKASDFAQLAAALIYIKSRALLPKLTLETEEEIDPEVELIERLKLYKIFKEAGGKIKELESSAAGQYFKLPEEIVGEQVILNLDGVDVKRLYDAFMKILQSAPREEIEQKQDMQIKLESFSVRQKRKEILAIIAKKKRVVFEELFHAGASRLEIAVTFLALLDLVFRQDVRILQQSTFSDIEISVRSE